MRNSLLIYIKYVTDVTYMYFYYTACVCSRYNVHSDFPFLEDNSTVGMTEPILNSQGL